MPTKERTKENCRCFDAADPRLGGCTPPRPPKRKSEGAGAKRKQYYFSFLTPPPLPLPLSRGFPRTPVVFNGCYNLGRSPQKAPHAVGSWPGLALYLVRPHLPQTSRPSAAFRSAALPPQLPQNPPQIFKQIPRQHGGHAAALGAAVCSGAVEPYRADRGVLGRAALL